MAEDTCCICLEILNFPIELKECKHLFCKVCIDEWLQKSKNCPICRNETIYYQYNKKLCIKYLCNHSKDIDILVESNKEIQKIWLESLYLFQFYTFIPLSKKMINLMSPMWKNIYSCILSNINDEIQYKLFTLDLPTKYSSELLFNYLLETNKEVFYINNLSKIHFENEWKFRLEYKSKEAKYKYLSPLMTTVEMEDNTIMTMIQFCILRSKDDVSFVTNCPKNIIKDACILDYCLQEDIKNIHQLKWNDIPEMKQKILYKKYINTNQNEILNLLYKTCLKDKKIDLNVWLNQLIDNSINDVEFIVDNWKIIINNFLKLHKDCDLKNNTIVLK